MSEKNSGADMVDVIRCRDCAWMSKDEMYEFPGEKLVSVPWCNCYNVVTKEDGYCHCGTTDID